jgi:hypothetical protein
LQATNYKNSKLNKKYIKQFKIYKINPLKFRAMLGRLMDLQEQWRHFFSTRHRHWRRIGSHAAARNAGKWVGLAQLLLVFSFF